MRNFPSSFLHFCSIQHHISINRRFQLKKLARNKNGNSLPNFEEYRRELKCPSNFRFIYTEILMYSIWADFLKRALYMYWKKSDFQKWDWLRVANYLNYLQRNIFRKLQAWDFKKLNWKSANIFKDFCRYRDRNLLK